MLNYILIKLLQYKIKELDKKSTSNNFTRKITHTEFVMYDKIAVNCDEIIKFLKVQNKRGK